MADYKQAKIVEGLNIQISIKARATNSYHKIELHPEVIQFLVLKALQRDPDIKGTLDPLTASVDISVTKEKFQDGWQ